VIHAAFLHNCASLLQDKRTRRAKLLLMKRPILPIALACLTALVQADKTQAASDEVFFIDKVYPLMKEKCMACHGDRPDKIKGGYDMRTHKGMLEGGDSGEAAIVKGQPNQSPFFIALTWADEDLQMPPKENDRLNAEQIEIFREWIERGAPWSDPSAKRAVAWGDVSEDGMVVKTSGGLDDSWTYRRYAVDGLWAYQPIAKIKPPRADVPPVDAFVDARLAKAGVKAAPRAGKLDLLRRATFGLTGLPPTPAEVQAFLADGSTTAFATVVERLLASSHYGEKMTQHWLDVVRYADTSGFSNDFERPTAWRYRDYVVRSFNADKPYDQFVREQLAGDELPDAGSEGPIAVGFLRMGPWEHTAMSVAAETRQQFLDDVTHSVGVTFLGQQLRCCKCHDHKFDPLPTQDYYGFQALFATVQFADRPLPFLENENTDQMAAGKERLQRRMNNANSRDKYLDQQVQKIVANQVQERGPKGMSEEERKQAYELAMKDQKIAVGKAIRALCLYGVQRPLARGDEHEAHHGDAAARAAKGKAGGYSRVDRGQHRSARPGGFAEYPERGRRLRLAGKLPDGEVLFRGNERPSHHFGELDSGSRKSPDRAGDGEPGVATLVQRAGVGGHAQRLRQDGKAPHTPRVARLPRALVHGPRLVGEKAAELHHGVGSLSTRRGAGGFRNRPERRCEPVVGLFPAPPSSG
jgi:mono/diheme cytochrome c family protein